MMQEIYCHQIFKLIISFLTQHHFPLEQMLDMKNADEQINELRHNLAKKENQMVQREKEMREELLQKEKELSDRLAKKDQECMEKVEDLRSQLRKRDTEVYTRKDSVISIY